MRKSEKAQMVSFIYSVENDYGKHFRYFNMYRKIDIIDNTTLHKLFQMPFLNKCFFRNKMLTREKGKYRSEQLTQLGQQIKSVKKTLYDHALIYNICNRIYSHPSH